MDSQSIKNDFPLLKNRDIAYLDSSATTQKPKAVIDAVNEFYAKYNANVHRGTYNLSVEASLLYEGVREKVARFINAANSEEIIFSKNATESLNLIAYSYGLDNLKKGDEVVISIMEHHSNLVPWQVICQKTGATLKYMYLNEDYEITDEEIESKITDKTKIVGIVHVSNALGVINDVKKIVAKAHEKGAVTVVDAAQSVPHMRIDVQNLNCDFLAFSGHKMLSPLGIGVLYGKKELLNAMNPFLMGGDMIEYVREQETTFAPLPNKFEAGTQNVEGVIGLGAAVDYIERIGYDNIYKIEKELTDYAIERIKKLDYVELYIAPDEKRRMGVLSFNVKNVHSHDVASILDSIGVCVRSGNHCAQPLLKHIGVDSTCRASFYLYNTKDDVDRLIAGLDKVYSMFKKYM